MPIQWIEHKGTKILHIDVADLRNDHVTLNANLETLVALLRKEPRNSVLAVADLRGTYLSNNVLMALMRNAPSAAPHFRKSALVIELNYARRVLLDSFYTIVRRIPKRFTDLDAAKAWLVDDIWGLPIDEQAVKEKELA